MKEKNKDFVEDCFASITENMLKASILYRNAVKKFCIEGVIDKELVSDTQLLHKAVIQSLEELMDTAEELMNYIVVTNVGGAKQLVQCSTKESALEFASFYHGDDGKAYIFTNDLSVGGRDEKVGGTIICIDAKDVENKAEKMLKSK